MKNDIVLIKILGVIQFGLTISLYRVNDTYFVDYNLSTNCKKTRLNKISPDIEMWIESNKKVYECNYILFYIKKNGQKKHSQIYVLKDELEVMEILGGV